MMHLLCKVMVGRWKDGNSPVRTNLLGSAYQPPAIFRKCNWSWSERGWGMVPLVWAGQDKVLRHVALLRLLKKKTQENRLSDNVTWYYENAGLFLECEVGRYTVPGSMHTWSATFSFVRSSLWFQVLQRIRFKFAMNSSLFPIYGFLWLWW